MRRALLTAWPQPTHLPAHLFQPKIMDRLKIFGKNNSLISVAAPLWCVVPGEGRRAGWEKLVLAGRST